MKDNFQSALELVPKGVLVSECKSQDISYANQETFKLLNVIHKSEIKEALEKYVLKIKHNEMFETSEETNSMVVDENVFDS